MIYDLWDFTSANIIATFATREEALSVVKQALSRHGVEYAETLLFGQQDHWGQTRAIARGKKLVEMALAEASAPSA